MDIAYSECESDGNLFSHATAGAVQWVGLFVSEVIALFRAGFRRPFRRALWLVLALPGLTLLHALNWICLLLDELLFPAARRLDIVKPVFIIGPPRSGTTHFHRILSDARSVFSVAPAWEVLLAPSILQKKGLRGMIRLDRVCGRPLARLLTRLERYTLRAFSDTHPGTLRDPEEDYFYLGPILACTGWLLAFPFWKGFRSYMPGCPQASEAKRHAALQFYRRCLRKQLYVDGKDKTLLSKNASFSSWMDLLPDYFPDACFLVCMRSPLETVPSMLSTAEKAMRGFASELRNNDIQRLLVDSMKAHYQVLHHHIPQLPEEQTMVVEQSQLKNHLTAVMHQVSRQTRLALPPAFWERLKERDRRARQHQSMHRYSLDTYGLDAAHLLSACPELTATFSPTS